MKKIGIVTIIDNDNYGNRLQNYALYKYCSSKYNYDVETLINEAYSNDKRFFFIRCLKNYLLKNKYKIINNDKRTECFEKFNLNIKFSKTKINCFSQLDNYEYLIVGSDQVWNPYFRRLRDLDLLVGTKNSKRISYAASFGVNNIPENKSKKMIKELKKFKKVSVREKKGKEIIENLEIRDDVEILIDPTMLLCAEEWDKVVKKPEQLDSDKKYILNYFLGNLSEDRKHEIERIAKNNNCEIINILDKNSPFYQTGPSEFLYLEKNAFLICTDSFHSSVFAILYNKPFIVFDREDGTVKMNSRIENLISKFELKDRMYEGKITENNLKNDYNQAYKILECERLKSKKFLDEALN